MPTIPRNRTNLAELLGIAKSAVTAQAARGMPTHDLEAAQAWRKRNLDPNRTKGNRFDAHYQRRPVQAPARPAATPEPAWFELAALALDLAELVDEAEEPALAQEVAAEAAGLGREVDRGEMALLLGKQNPPAWSARRK